MHARDLGWAVLWAAAVATPADAASSGTATLSDFGYELIDLDPNDGIAPAIEFLWQRSAAFVSGDGLSAQDEAAGWFQVTQAYLATALMVASATTDGGGASAFGSAAGSDFRAYASPLSSIGFTLTPMTGLAVSAAIEGTAAVTLGDGSEYARAYGVLRMQVGFSGDIVTRSDSQGRYVGGCIPAWCSASFAERLSVRYDNQTDASVSGLLTLYADTYGASPHLPAVPEPTSWALMLLGLGAVARVVPRRR